MWWADGCAFKDSTSHTPPYQAEREKNPSQAWALPSTLSIPFIFYSRRSYHGGWRDVSVVKRTGSSSRGLVFNSQHPQGCSQLSATRIPLFWHLRALHTCYAQTYQQQKQHTHKKFYLLMKKTQLPNDQWLYSWSWILISYDSGIFFECSKLTAEIINKWISIKYADFLGRNFMKQIQDFSYNKQFNHKH